MRSSLTSTTAGISVASVCRFVRKLRATAPPKSTRSFASSRSTAISSNSTPPSASCASPAWRPTLEARLRQAQSEKHAPIDLVSALVGDELVRRQDRLIARCIRQARFLDAERSLETFDLDFNKKMNRALTHGLATARFIQQREDVLFLGPPGTGKSHFAKAIGHAAILQGHRVLYREAPPTLRGPRRRHRTSGAIAQRQPSLGGKSSLAITIFYRRQSLFRVTTARAGAIVGAALPQRRGPLGDVPDRNYIKDSVPRLDPRA